MPDRSAYSIAVDNRFGYQTVIDVPALAAANTEPWFHQTLTQVDESVVRLGIVQGEFFWHHHDDEDELFFVLDGELEIDIEGAETVVLGPHQGYNVPKGTRHRTRANASTTMLMVSAASVEPTGDES